MLTRAPATLRRNADTGTWMITLRDDLETEADREVAALPSEVLEEMITHIRGRTQVQWFELTAMVLSYRNHNYLLPLMATPLSSEPPRPPKSFMMPPGTVPERAAAALTVLRSAGLVPAAAAARIEFASAPAAAPANPAPTAASSTAPAAATPAPTAASSTAPATATPAPTVASSSAPAPAAPSSSVPVGGAAASRGVDAAGAPIAAGGSPPADGASSAAPDSGVDPERFAAEVERALEERIKVVPRSGDAVPVPSPFAPQRPERRFSGGAAPVLLATHVRVQDRRGVVTRDPVTGTWRFVMLGERAEMGERGLELLPCAALERLERYVKQAEIAPALLVSGRVTRFEGRNFLLPSSFRSIASGRWIYP